MKKKLWIFAGLVAACTVAILGCAKEDGNWVHKTFQGTVTDIEAELGDTVFTVVLDSGTEKNFIINDLTIYAIAFQAGDRVVIESDYNLKEHNGTDVPYPATMIANPAVTG